MTLPPWQAALVKAPTSTAAVFFTSSPRPRRRIILNRSLRSNDRICSSIMFYTGDKFPRWKNNLFVGALTTQQLIRVAFGQPNQAERREGLLIPMRVRIRDVQQSPDGYIYVATEGASGGNASDGMVLRIEPVD